MKVLIYPTDDRLGQASLIDHYNRIGCDVYLPARGALGFNWSRMSLWPSLLCKSSEAGLRNIDKNQLHTVETFGEDLFLDSTIFSNNEKDLPICNLLTEDEIRNTEFDIYHTLRGADEYLHAYKEIAKKSFPNSKWISSTLSAHEFQPKGLLPHKVAKIIPAPYSSLKIGMNIYCTDVEFRLFGVNKTQEHTQEVASFNHNFHVRQPKDYELFCKMNKILESRDYTSVINYGGNIRGMGADIRYSNGGPTGNYTTLSPVENIMKIMSLAAIVHFKNTDWGGGVFFHALHTCTPIITTKRYINASNSHDFLVNGLNCIAIDSAEEAADAVVSITSDERLRSSLSQGMKTIRDACFNDEYWTRWEEFVKE